ncbi:MAG: rRNA pseudouridine synthase [Puniceicoccales bacterium]|nr:rRNA pseudouridine synthase [Puniceicoccales bacterium]
MEENGQFQRIQKFLSARGICSRRSGEKAIREGRVTVNGQFATIGQLINPHVDTVAFDGEMVCLRAHQKFILLALHKPRGYVCTHCDPHCSAADTIYSLLPAYGEVKLICCGRLDKDSEGLVLLTNDGDLAAKLLHPSSCIAKHYMVEIHIPLQECHRKALLNGVESSGDTLRAAHVAYITDGRRRLHIILHEGRKRHIRRMLECFGYRIGRLVRFRIGLFDLDKIPLGHYRRLDESHLKKLLVRDKKFDDSLSECRMIKECE